MTGGGIPGLAGCVGADVIGEGAVCEEGVVGHAVRCGWC